ncbi:hypothetical protein ACFFYR_36790 [Paraburkholderia dipogonis]
MNLFLRDGAESFRESTGKQLSQTLKAQRVTVAHKALCRILIACLTA